MAILQNTSIDDSGFLKVPVGPTSQRPSSPSQGMIRFNTSSNKFELYDGSSWVDIS